jgi:Alkyl sulfatase dimerisation
VTRLPASTPSPVLLCEHHEELAIPNALVVSGDNAIDGSLRETVLLATLNRLPRVEEAKKYAEYMGGSVAVIARAREDFKAGRYRWVLR